MKTILLQFRNAIQKLDPTKMHILSDNGRVLHVGNRNPRVPWEMYLTRQADGTLVNENGVVYEEVKADRRPKPFKLDYDGPDGKGVAGRFATLQEAAQYIYDRWQGTDYQDSMTCFHTDYTRYYLTGFTLADIFTFTVEDYAGYPVREATRKVGL